MSDKDVPHELRLRKKHAPGEHETPTIADGARLIQVQSLRHAFMAGVIVAILFAVIWSMLSLALGRVLPWMTLLLGFLIGLAVRRGGQGLDWRFPTMAALLTFVGAVGANIVVAAGISASELDTGTFTVLRSVTSMTWPVFFDEVITAADFVYAAFAAGIAAFYANRRLSRRQFHALRIWEDERQNEQT